jgi:Dolichyl-phosphate-mannose-protein mannosyltransferase
MKKETSMGGLYYGISPLTAIIFLAALPILLMALHIGHHINGDEGVVLFGAWSLLSGHKPYVDDFQFITPASNYSLYWLWLLFGPNFWAAKGFGILSINLCALGIYLTGKQIASSHATSVSQFVGPFVYCLASFAWPTINHNTFNATVMCWALFFGVRYVKRNEFRDLAISGFLTGLSILFLQHKGGILLIAISVFLVAFKSTASNVGPLNRIKPAFIFSVFALVPLLTLLNWPVSVLYASLIDFPLNHYLTVNRTSKLPLVIVLICFIGIAIATNPKKNRPVQLVLLTQAMLFTTTLQRTDLAHVLVLTFPMLSMIFIPIDRLKIQLRRRPGLFKFADLSRKLTLTLILILGVNLWILRAPSFANLPANWPLLQEAKSRCKSIYAGPFLPGIYYELRLQNSTSFSYLLTNFNTPEQFLKAREQLEIAQPDCAILYHGNVAHFNYNANNPVEEFFSSHYTEHKVSDNTRLLVRRTN